MLIIASCAGLLLLSGCVLAPRGTKQERDRLEASGRHYEPAVEKRSVPELSQPASWREVLRRAFLANGDLEAAYFEWKAAFQRIDMAASYPNSNLQLGFDYMFSDENMKSWDRTTLSAGFDPAMSLQLPVKVQRAGKVALEQARAAGYRFESAKFDLQRQVLTSYLDLALTEEKVRVQRDNVALLKLLWDTAANRVQAGGPQQDLLKVQIEYQLAGNELASMEAEAQSMRSMLNGMLAREAQAPLTLPRELPPPRPVAADDARLIEVAVDRNPELAGLARQVAGRREALELARLRYIPDLSPAASITGSVSRAVGAMVMLPTNLPAIRSAINEERAMLRATEAMYRQVQRDRAASFVAALYLMRNAERQTALFQRQILPAAEQVLTTTRQAYTAGSVGFIELIDSQRTLLDVRLMIAEVRIEREQRLAELEALAGVDTETLARPSTATAPAAASGTTVTSGPSTATVTTKPTQMPSTQSGRGDLKP